MIVVSYSHSERGFSLTELLAVLAIIGILSVIAIPNYISYRERAKNTGRIAQLVTLKTLIEGYKFENGFYPMTPSSDWLNSNPRNPQYAAQYIPGFNDLPHDPYENEDYVAPWYPWYAGYMYMSNGVGYKLMSHDASNYYSGMLLDACRNGADLCGTCGTGPWPWAISVYSLDAPAARCW